MPKNIFDALFTYKENIKRSPQEDYFTEILCFILKRNKKLAKEYINYFFPSIKNIEIKDIDTQSSSDTEGGGRYDLIINLENNIALVFEHKIDSKERKGQLKKYLNNNELNYVVFLSKSESDVIEKNKSFKKEIRFVAKTWNEVYNDFFKRQTCKDQYRIYEEFIAYYVDLFELYDYKGFSISEGERIWLNFNKWFDEVSTFLRDVLKMQRKPSFNFLMNKYFLRAVKDLNRATNVYDIALVLDYYEDYSDEPHMDLELYLKRTRENDKYYENKGFEIKKHQIFKMLPYSKTNLKKIIKLANTVLSYEKSKHRMELKKNRNVTKDVSPKEIKRALEFFENLMVLNSKLIRDLSKDYHQEQGLKFEEGECDEDDFFFWVFYKKSVYSIGLRLKETIHLYVDKGENINSENIASISISEVCSANKAEYNLIYKWCKDALVKYILKRQQ